MTGLREVDSLCATRVYAVTGHTDYPMHTTCVSDDSETTDQRLHFTLTAAGSGLSCTSGSMMHHAVNGRHGPELQCHGNVAQCGKK